MALIFVINGPNLNLLGSREPAHYGHDTLDSIEHRLSEMATGLGHHLALRDALAAVAIPFTEVHLSNIYRREPFRQHSYFSDLAQGVISGFGATGYELALTAAHHYLTQPK